jgi:hypothetical protein
MSHCPEHKYVRQLNVRACDSALLALEKLCECRHVYAGNGANLVGVTPAFLARRVIVRIRADASTHALKDDVNPPLGVSVGDVDHRLRLDVA